MKVVPLRTVADPPGPVQRLGRLASVDADGQLYVEAEDGSIWPCRLAASCLLKPRPGDTVLLAGPDSRRVYLIAVIEQVDTSISCIEASGDLQLSAPAGSISIDSVGGLGMKVGRWDLEADEARCEVGEMHYTGRALDATVGRLRLVGRMFESVADRVVQMTRSALRLVDEVDQVRAGHLDVRAQETAVIHGKHVLLTGKELMKVDAGQIHMG